MIARADANRMITERMRMFVEESGLTVTEFARRCEISKECIYRWMRGVEPRASDYLMAAAVWADAVGKEG